MSSAEALWNGSAFATKGTLTMSVVWSLLDYYIVRLQHAMNTAMCHGYLAEHFWQIRVFVTELATSHTLSHCRLYR